MEEYSRGSEWRKWDLHIHTPLSIYQRFGGDDQFGNYLAALEKLPPEVKVIGVNDYYFIDGYEKVIKHKLKGNLKNIEKIFPVIEFRIDTFGSSDQNNLQKVNLHIVFDLDESKIDSEIKMVRDEFLTKIQIKNGDKEKHLGQGKTAFIDLAGDLDTGFNNIIPSTVQVLSECASPKWRNKVFVLLGYIEWNNLDKNNQIKPIKAELARKIDAFFTAGNSEHRNKETIIRQFTSNAPLLHSGDVHDFDKLGKNYLCNTWIKSDPTFEGLRQIAYEPDERVRLQATVPERKVSYEVIESIRIGHSDFPGSRIPLNQNLTTIIGGRSSGKSVLLGTIAKKVRPELKVKPSEEYNSYIASICEVSTLAWADGTEQETHDIDFFPQSYINDLAFHREKLDEIILDSVIKRKSEKKEALDLFRAFTIEQKSRINQETANYYSTLARLSDLDKESIEVGDKKSINLEIKKHEQELTTIKSKMTSKISLEDEELYRANLEKQKALNIALEQHERNLAILNALENMQVFRAFIPELPSFDPDFRMRIDGIVETVRRKAEGSLQDELKMIASSMQQEITVARSEVETLRQDSVYKACLEFFSQNTSYAETEKLLKAQQAKSVKLEQLQKEKDGLATKCTQLEMSILKLNEEYYDKANDLLAVLHHVLGDIQIVADVQFNSEHFAEVMGGRFNQKASWVHDLVAYEFESIANHREFMKGLLDHLVKNEIPIKGGSSTQQAIVDLFSESFLLISYDVNFQNDRLSLMSEGKKAFVILRILLEFSERKCPILIDQPEDDLDNRAIYDDLVMYLRQKKKDRQIILVTHSPNIVVGADAEQVIVANQHGTKTPNLNSVKFEYFSGSLENSKANTSAPSILSSQGIKQHVCDILEGGDKAFKIRERKYNLKRSSET